MQPSRPLWTSASVTAMLEMRPSCVLHLGQVGDVGVPPHQRVLRILNAPGDAFRGADLDHLGSEAVEGVRDVHSGLIAGRQSW